LDRESRSAAGSWNNLAEAFRRRPKFNIIAFTLTVLIAVAGLVIADLWWRRDHVLATADTRAANLSTVLSEYVRGSFSSADAALRQLAIHGKRIGGPSASHDDWEPILAAAKAALPESGSITVTDAAGVITHSTIRAIVGESRADSYIYQRLSKSAVEELVLDRPYLGRSEPRQYIIPVGRPLKTPDGKFAGILVATVMPQAYRAFFNTIDVGPDGVISVLHPDGVVLFREPSSTDHINEAAADDLLLRLAQQHPMGLVHAPLTPGGPTHISAYRTVGGPPVVVAVSLSQDDVLQDWRRQRRVSATAFGALTVTLGAIVMLLFRMVDARERAERELRDVQAQEAERLRESNERLEAALEREQHARRETEAASYLKDEFLMTVSHELRTPLTAIYGWARVLGTKQMDAAQQARAIAAIERNAHAQTRLIEDLLDVSRAISGKLRLDARPINVADVLRAAVETVSQAMAAKRITLHTDFESPTPPIVADPDRLQQIVWNLLANATKFTPEGGTVSLRLARADSQVEIVVSDTGSGISPEFLPFVFERFRQADAGSRRRYGGLGLGLAIVRHLVELHGGTVRATSPGEGQGATFHVTLPLRPIAAGEAAEPAAAAGARVREDAARLDGIRVLVVDDEADSRELFGSILEAAGAAVLRAPSAADALPILDHEDVDVLITDIEMPGEDGYHLLERARTAHPDRPLAAIAVTAYARAADRRRALDAGFKWHLAKPVEPSELVAAVASLATSKIAD
jgi:signal transduction histidine kinase/ActR/RegA family two-component response regulator